MNLKLRMKSIDWNRKFYIKDIFNNIVEFIVRELFSISIFLSIYVKTFLFIIFTDKNESILDALSSTSDYTAVFIVLFISIGYLLKNNARRWYLVIADFIFSLIFIIDLVYISAFEMLPSISELKEISSLTNEGNGFISLLDYKYILFFIDILVFIVIILKTKKKNDKYKINLCICIILLLCIGSKLYQFTDIVKGSSSYAYNSKTYMSNVSKYSIIGYHIADIYYYITPQKNLYKNDIVKIQKWFSNNYENNTKNNYFGMFKKKNVIYLQVESLENFVINHKINGQEITPNLNKIISNSFYFNNFYEQVNEGTSSDADLLANASIYPIRSGSTFYLYQGRQYNTIGSILKKNDYKTQAIYSMDGTVWNWMPNMCYMGYDKILDVNYFNDYENINLGISDKCLLKQVVPVIKGSNTPFFTDIITLTNHMPYILPNKYKEISLPDNIKSKKLGNYFETVHYTDEAIGDFLNDLDKSGILDNTIIVLYGDHCGIHKYYASQVKDIKDAENWYKYYDHKIPLIIYSKGMKGETINTIGGQIDIMPTVLSLLGIENSNYKNTAMGRNLLNTKKSFAVLSDGTIIGNLSPDEKKHAVSGLEISDMIIKSNYFKNYAK